MEQRATYLSLGLTSLCWLLLAVGICLSFEPGWRFFRLLGFGLGGMVSVATFFLCLYYLRIRRVKTTGVKVATAVCGAYGVAFIALSAALLGKHPAAAKWLVYAF